MDTIVVSETNDKLSPKKAPPTTAPIATGIEIPLACRQKSAATGPTAATVPRAEPIAVDKKADIRNMPINKNFAGTNDIVQFTKDSIEPMLLVTSPNAPAKRKIMHI